MYWFIYNCSDWFIALRVISTLSQKLAELEWAYAGIYIYIYIYIYTVCRNICTNFKFIIVYFTLI